jgi:glycopeptide antibiotics resistance protein
MSHLLVFIKNKCSEILILYLLLLLVFFVYPFDVENKINTVKVAGTFRLDHILHVIIFIPAAFVFFNKFKWKLVVLFLVIHIMASGFEFIQWFIPYRAFTVKDLQANLIGALLGFVLFYIGIKKLVPLIENK